MDMQKMWVDSDRCTGCGACVDVCPSGAITLVEGKAHIDEAICTGCAACVNVCPESAIQPVIQGELVPAPERPAPTVYRPGPLVETAGAAVVVAGGGLLIKAARVLTRPVGRWLARRPAATRPFLRQAQDTTTRGASRAKGEAGRGRRARHRRRGR